MLVGHMKGGLRQVNIVGSMVFAGMSGSALADAMGLGAIEVKAMTERGYDRLSAACSAAPATVGPVIPPSIPLVLFGSMTGVSVGVLFLGGVVPGLIMGVAMMVGRRDRRAPAQLPVRAARLARHRAPRFADDLAALVTPG